MRHDDRPTIGVVFAQFAAYHVDRCQAAAERLEGRYRVIAVEVATRSHTYAWEPSGAVAGAEKQTLFSGKAFEDVNWFARLRAEFAALRRCRVVFMGLPYSLPDAMALSWLLRLIGVRTIVMTESKFDDMPRRLWREVLKAILLTPFHGALTGGHRQAEYMRFLGFRRRAVKQGYDTVGLDRIRREAASAKPIAWVDRPFAYVGRFAPKKNLPRLLRGYARYRELDQQPRRLRLVGDGELRAELERLARDLRIEDAIDWPGFVAAEAVSCELAGALALCLVSTEEQWGLVVNEALAVGLPVIVSSPVGARDVLVRSGLNGFVVEPDDIEQIAHSMQRISADEATWKRFSYHSLRLSPQGDTRRFADGVEALLAREPLTRGAVIQALPSGTSSDTVAP